MNYPGSSSLVSVGNHAVGRTLQLLYHRGPPPDPTTDAPLLSALYGGTRPRHADRPWVVMTMIASLDGATAVDGRSGALGGSADRLVFAAVRAAVDLVLVGRSTAAAERYRPPAKPGQRVGVVSRGLDMTRDEELLSSELFSSGCGFLVLPEAVSPPTGIDTIRSGAGDDVDLAAAIRQLDEIGPEPAVVGLEGGPTLNGAALAAGIVDELNATIAGVLAGGDSPRMVDGADAELVALELEHVVVADDSLFTRWIRPV